MKECFYKILVVGDLGTGKTSILKRYVEKIFSTRYKSTIGVDFALKVVQYNAEITINLQLWDIAGQERFGSMTRAYYRGASGAFVVYDVTRPGTFQNAVKWKRDLDDKVDGESFIPVILLANKTDQVSNPTPVNEMDEFCKQNGFLKWFDTSAKDDKNIEEAAYSLLDYIIQNDTHSLNDSDDSQLDLVTLD
ncbi:hypothetical protein K501DRAFT_214846, partial [Backusella circina FSU 941]